jgi:ubiquinone/menaquinone biosynthesis C-methylase UbiE/uncharacterized membrane protein YbhN (UPF0104 family)
MGQARRALQSGAGVKAFVALGAPDSATAAPLPAAAVPKSVAWMLLVAAAVGVLLTGLAGTALIVANIDRRQVAIPPAFWEALLASGLLTLASLTLRALRWAFLLRRSDVRIPIRDADIGYFVGLSLLFVPLLVGEMAVRSFVQRSRAGVPIATTCVVNLWERVLDVCALATIASVAALAVAPAPWAAFPLVLVALSFSQSLRSIVLRAALRLAGRISRRFGDEPVREESIGRLAGQRTWAVALAASIGAWVLPGLGFWALAAAWPHVLTASDAQLAYAAGALKGGLVLAPGGVLVVGGSLLGDLQRHGFSAAEAAVTVLGARIATAGIATALGCIFLVIHFRQAPTSDSAHFDEIAHAYDVQIPERRRLALLANKTERMRSVLEQRAVGRRGLDVGCGQGWYVARMRELAFDVEGIDESMAQVEAARRHVDDLAAIAQGSALNIPAPDASYDFAYCINVLHHLPSTADQQRAFAEIERVLRPGGLLFVQEIHTRNVLFRFYMGYVFPTLNCIDEGVERWLLPDRLPNETSMAVVATEHFTFLPEFLPHALVTLFRPIERLLEASPLRVYSAHYMAVLQKPR